MACLLITITLLGMKWEKLINYLFFLFSEYHEYASKNRRRKMDLCSNSGKSFSIQAMISWKRSTKWKTSHCSHQATRRGTIQSCRISSGEYKLLQHVYVYIYSSFIYGSSCKLNQDDARSRCMCWLMHKDKICIMLLLLLKIKYYICMHMHI